ncbi:uncharacterized protein LOC117569650 isoform X1 [Drosophila albomicans]|uniref:Uncharacterized protein LOC117569650 isoform X1 n=1 Tax=Drosophila albomicans TaxID=7291 RepID=A0A6P8X4T2_DROAB|nr:uncharacterized protein LOC117569650 isoform X1 [Drosophila albomicans]
MLLKLYQLAIAIALCLACFSPEVSSRRIQSSHRRTHYTNNYTAGWNYTSHNISYQNHHLAKPAYNSGPNLIYGNHTGNYSLHGGYRPHNNTSFPTYYPAKYDYMPNPIHGNHTGNYSLHGGDHPHNISFPTYYPANPIHGNHTGNYTLHGGDHPHNNISFPTYYPANPIHGNHTGNYSLPHNSTNIFARLFKLW